ncbi:MAG: response regulator [Pseudomonadota bacterium]
MLPKILLAEDDALSRFMMSEMLEELEVEYAMAKNGAECTDLIQADPKAYAMILMDVHMPKKTGLEATRDIRSAAGNPPRDIPIIAVTADQHWQDPERCADAGFTNVIPKPVSMAVLEAKIREVLAI